MENPAELRQLILDVCEAVLDNAFTVSANNLSIISKANQIKKHFGEVRLSPINSEMLAALWMIIDKSDFVAIVGGRKLNTLDPLGNRHTELNTTFVGEGSQADFGYAIAQLCMQGAQNGFAESVVAFLQQANQLAMQQAKQLPTPKPKIEIVS